LHPIVSNSPQRSPVGCPPVRVVSLIRLKLRISCVLIAAINSFVKVARFGKSRYEFSFIVVRYRPWELLRKGSAIWQIALRIFIHRGALPPMSSPVKIA
jgi:hypothetical protein